MPSEDKISSENYEFSKKKEELFWSYCGKPVSFSQSLDQRVVSPLTSQSGPSSGPSASASPAVQAKDASTLKNIIDVESINLTADMDLLQENLPKLNREELKDLLVKETGWNKNKLLSRKL